MRHNVFGRKLNRDVKERKSLFKSLVTALVIHGKITTTETKARAIRGLVDKLVTKAKEGTLHSRRQIASFLNHKDVVKRFVDVVVPSFKGRNSGYTRIIKLGTRPGDAAQEVMMEWVDKVEELKVVKAAKVEEKAVVAKKETKVVKKKPEVKEKKK